MTKLPMTYLKKLPLTLLMLGFLLVATGCSSDNKPTIPPPLVTVKTITPKDIIFTAEYMGQTQGFKSVDVLSRVQGVMLKRLYTEGEFVKQGQPLFEIEPDSYQGSLQQAEGNLAQARARFKNAGENLKRIRPLFEKNAVSQRDMDAAQAEYDDAKAQVEASQGALKIAKVEYGYTTVVSPVAGFSSKEALSAGNIVYNGSKLTTVNMVDPLYVNFAIAAPDYMRLAQMMASGQAKLPADDGRPATLTLVDGSLFKEQGMVTFVDSLVDPMVGVVRARATFPNPNAEVMPGQFVRIKVEMALLPQALLIPQQSVIQTQAGAIIYVLEDNGTAIMRPVKANLTYGQEYIVESGLSSGERIVVEGTNKVTPNKPVMMAEPNATAYVNATPAAPARNSSKRID